MSNITCYIFFFCATISLDKLKIIIFSLNIDGLKKKTNKKFDICCVEIYHNKKFRRNNNTFIKAKNIRKKFFPSLLLFLLINIFLPFSFVFHIHHIK